MNSEKPIIFSAANACPYCQARAVIEGREKGDADV